MFDRDEQEISQIIETGLEAILSGQATLEEVLAEHPLQEAEIRGELQGVMWLTSRRQEVEARPGFLAASRKRVIERIKAEAGSQGIRRALFGFAWPRRFSLQWVAAATVILVLFFSAGGIVSVSANSLPGDELYAIKRVSEQVAYSVTLSDVKRVELSTQFANRRLNEVEDLIAKGNIQKAQATIQEYKQHVNRTLALLQQVDDASAREKLGAALAFKDELQRHDTLLVELQAGAPANLASDLRDAQGTASLSMDAASNMIEDLVEPTGTPTPTSTGTETPVGTTTPIFTETPQPSSTVDPTFGAPDNDTDAIQTLTPGDPSSTPDVSKTPKPKPDPKGNNPNKPEKPVKPEKGKSDPPGKNK